ncbi:hypothetical protein SKAU_G00037890 [Synaphobranchus kaupii]|uniref:Uncharacterized protein n=1 Tax=Synaphobranchus kaupii TaxID=118154 RepID=A0A9Q1GEW3_SYNKA|nr:hypothetical protein SKAU_G00037890 [Synaphobranchus kaupii]
MQSGRPLQDANISRLSPPRPPRQPSVQSRRESERHVSERTHFPSLREAVRHSGLQHTGGWISASAVIRRLLLNVSHSRRLKLQKKTPSKKGCDEPGSPDGTTLAQVSTSRFLPLRGCMPLPREA